MRRGKRQATGAVILTALLVLAVACRGEPGTDTSALLVTDAADRRERVRASLAHECIVAGGEQALTIQVEGGVGVQYVSTYADGESGRREPFGGGYGGEGFGVSQEGLVEGSWTVSKETPPGLVIVYVSALLPDADGVDPDEALTRLRLSFLLMGPDDECPTGEPELPAPEVLTDTGDAHPGLRASLATACVQAGDDQTLTLRGEPSTVSYTTIYANGENGGARPDGGAYGGSGTGLVGPEGEAEFGWTIKEEAPPGVAVLLLAVSPLGQDTEEEAVRLELAFRVAGPEEECP